MDNTNVSQRAKQFLQLTREYMTHKNQYQTPRFKNIHTTIERLKLQCDTLIVEYVKSRNENLLKDRELIGNEIEALIYYEVLINDEFIKNLNDLNQKKARILNEIDSKSKRTNVNLLQQNLQDIMDHQDIISGKAQIDYYIEQLDLKLKRKTDEIQKKSKSTKVRNEENIDPNNDFPFDRLPVHLSSKEECNSRSRTKPYFVSKEQLIQTIKDDPVLQQRFGKNYQKLSKAELCDVIFGSS